MTEKELVAKVAYMFQHSDTGELKFASVHQMENGFEEENPKLILVCPLYRKGGSFDAT
ncbi:MAG: hypothetical protein R8M45_03775 [Ghiorsea sp.]